MFVVVVVVFNGPVFLDVVRSRGIARTCELAPFLVWSLGFQPRVSVCVIRFGRNV